MLLWQPSKARSGKTRLELIVNEADLDRLVDVIVENSRTGEVGDGKIFVSDVEEDLSIVKVKQFYFKPMTREEAVMQMNLLDHNFFAFRDEDNGGAFAVVYRRKDGGYGLIEDVG